MSDPHPFEKLTTKMQQSLRRQTELRYENNLVVFLLNSFQLTKKTPELLQRQREYSGEERLTLATFNERFSDFPVLLGADRLKGVELHKDPRAMIPALFRTFHKAPFVDAYRNFYDSVTTRAAERTVGLVFPRKGLRHGLIIHNGGLDDFWHRGMVWTYHGGRRSAPAKLYVQSFGALVEAIREQVKLR